MELNTSEAYPKCLKRHHRIEIGLWLVGLLAGLLTVLGWWVWFFWTDDAFIAFRYVSNSQLGLGYVWNAPPFEPVEGYTSFLWVFLLDTLWSATGLSPVSTAPVLSLFLGLLSLALSFWMLVQQDFAEGQQRVRTWLIALALGFLVSNRTFLMWMSSGLESALFNCLALGWAASLLGFQKSQRPLLRGWLLSLLAGLLALTRPDGLLWVAGTFFYLFWRSRKSSQWAAWQLAACPLLMVLVHLLWRFGMYGEWLPNTYFAKVGASWPESGFRYLACFFLEYGLIFWLILVFRAIVDVFREGLFKRERAEVGVLLGVLLCHLAFYVWKVGGDHFEYRIFSHWIPLLAVAALWAICRLKLRPALAAAWLCLLLVAGAILPWTHWFKTRNLTNRSETWMLVEPLALEFPWPFSVYVQAFDDLQAWLIPRHVGMRHQEHKVLFETLRKELPSRAEGSRFGPEGIPVMVTLTVGLAGWVFPHVAILDALGLNDRVISRNPTTPRKMAHSRKAPPGYLECFHPNLQVRFGHPWLRVRGPSELVDIQFCEQQNWLSGPQIQVSGDRH